MESEKETMRRLRSAVSPHVMDFDHVRGKKTKNLSAMVSHFGMEAIKAEIAKCDVVCANCHRERTFHRQKLALSEFQI
jgi:hypothetical protein